MSAPVSFQITIVGAGLAGLAAATCLAQKGHQVQVLERSSELSKLGAGLQVPPNAMRILDSWGLNSALHSKATTNEGTKVRRYRDGRVLAIFRGSGKELYGHLATVIHRADLQRILYDAAVEAGAQILFRRKVVSIDTTGPSLTLEDGSVIKSDLIVGADGIGSKIRNVLFPGESFQLKKSLDCIVRIVMSSLAMKKNPDVAHLVETPGSASVGVWNEAGNMEDVREEYADFEKTVRGILNCANECHRWMLAEVPDLPTWSSPSGKVVLLGDAAHAMMPYTAQGAAMGFEDAAVLGECLSRVRSADKIPRVVRAYEEIRKPRAERVKEISWGNHKTYAFPDGPKQEARDRLYAKSLETPGNIAKTRAVSLADSTAAYATPEFSMWLFGYDMAKDVVHYFGKNVA